MLLAVFLPLIALGVVHSNPLKRELNLRMPTQAPGYNGTNGDLQTLQIHGLASFRRGGDSLLLSLLIKGQNGIMPPPIIALPPSPPAHLPSPPPPASTSPTTAPSSTPLAWESTGSSPSSNSVGSSQATKSPTTGPLPTSASPSSKQDEMSTEFRDYEEEGLKLHNKFRKVHQSRTMALDEELCRKAQAWADHLAQTGEFKHSSREERNGEGENLSFGCSTNNAQTVTQAVTNWYNEICTPGYYFNTGGYSGGTGHFTQVVWNESNKLGIGHALTTKNGMKCSYTVARYKPAGNMAGQFGNNVRKGSFDRNAYCSTINDSPSSHRIRSQESHSKIM